MKIISANLVPRPYAEKSVGADKGESWVVYTAEGYLVSVSAIRSALGDKTVYHTIINGRHWYGEEEGLRKHGRGVALIATGFVKEVTAISSAMPQHGEVGSV